MRYLGMAHKEKGQIVMPDSFTEVPDGTQFDVLEVGGDILLVQPPLDHERLAQIEQIIHASIEEHRKTLEGLAR